MKDEDKTSIKERQNMINEEAIEFCEKMQFSKSSSSNMKEATKSIQEKK